MDGQQTFREAMHRLHERSAKDLFRPEATSLDDLVHQLSSRPRGPASGCPAVVMVQPTHDRESDHLVPCILTARNRSLLLRDVLCNPLMRPCLVEVHDIRLEKPGELLLLEDQEVIQACSPYAPQKTFTDGIREGAFDTGFEAP